MWFICYLILQHVALILAQEEDFGEETKRTIIEYSAAVDEHRRVCGVHPTCGPVAQASSPCCGFCSCEDKCHEYGSCCLSEYSGYPEALSLTTNSRSECVHAQYLSAESTDYNTGAAYWMITKCGPQYTDMRVKQLCEGHASSIDTLIPVTDPFSMTNYKNRFCVYCNDVEGVPKSIDWYLQIISDHNVSLPNDNLLTEIESNRGNIIPIPPDYVIVQPCDPFFSYRITTCNETGLWIKFEKDIETACHSFIDPFNYTYKNYFCYVCNTEEPGTTDLNCERKVVSDRALPRFSPVVALSEITGQQQQQKLTCNGDAFPDEIAMVCRPVFCQNNKLLGNGICASETITTSGVTCSSFFLQLTAFDQSYADPYTELSSMRQMQLTANIRYSLYDVTGGDGSIQQFLAFYKVDINGFIDYIIVYIEVAFKNNAKKDSYLQSILDMHYLVSSYYGEHDISFNVTVDQYNMYLHDGYASVFVPNESNTTHEQLTTEQIYPDEYTCPEIGITALNKLYSCPIINIDVNQFSVRIGGNSLVFYVDGISVASLSNWEYDLQGDIVSLCLEDFLIIHAEMQPDETSGGFREIFGTYEKLFTLSLAVITYVLPQNVFRRDCNGK